MYRENKSVIPFIRRKPYADLVYLTWIDDPLTTMTIQWHTIETRTGAEPNPEVKYREINSPEWLVATGSNHDMLFPDPINEKRRVVHWTTLRGLSPNTAYEFAFNGDDRTVYKFKTAPSDLSSSLKIAFASDSHYGIQDITDSSHETIPMIVERIKEAEPDVVVHGGDFGYDDGNVSRGVTMQWIGFMKMMQSGALLNSDGFMIPFIPTLGNHDGGQQKGAPYGEGNAVNFSNMFAFPISQNYLYGRLNFGDYLQLLVLDSGWGNPIEQCTNWLAQEIDGSKKHVIPFYHRPLYGYRGDNIDLYDEAIAQWAPLFENNNVKISFNGHLHNYYYTKPILNGEVNENGVVYCGNGAWGLKRTSRDFTEPTPEWIERQAHSDFDSENVTHFYLITLENEKATVDAINKDGFLFERFSRMV